MLAAVELDPALALASEMESVASVARALAGVRQHGDLSPRGSSSVGITGPFRGAARQPRGEAAFVPWLGRLSLLAYLRRD